MPETNELSKKEQYEARRSEKRVDNLNQNPKKSRVSLWVFLLLLISATVFAFTALSDRNENPENTASTTPAAVAATIKTDDWRRGEITSPVVLVEYSDFQCPACRSYHPILNRLSAELGDRLVFVYRHFPLISVHPNAVPAARAAEAAGRQGKFFEMHDQLFEKQTAWANHRNPETLFESYAATLGLDLQVYKSDFKSEAVRDRVDRDFREALKLGLNSTPSFFLNGERINNPQNYENFKTLVQEAAAN